MQVAYFGFDPMGLSKTSHGLNVGLLDHPRPTADLLVHIRPKFCRCGGCEVSTTQWPIDANTHLSANDFNEDLGRLSRLIQLTDRGWDKFRIVLNRQEAGQNGYPEYSYPLKNHCGLVY